MWNTSGNTRACSRPDSRKRQWSRRCLKTGSGGSPSVSRRQTASNTGSAGALPGRRGAGGAEALSLPGKRLGGILCKGPAPRLAADAQHLRLADLISGRGAAGRGERKRHAGGLFRGRYGRAPTTHAASGCRSCGRSRLRTTAPKRQRPPRCWGFYKAMARWDPWRGCRRCSEGCLHCRPGTSAGRARLAGINYTCEAGEKSHELQDHR